MTPQNRTETSIENLQRIFNAMYQWAEKESYCGWDPYDWMNSPLSKRLPASVNNIMIRINLYLPVNLRPVCGIEKMRSNKALALFSRAYADMYTTTHNEAYKQEMEKLLNTLYQNRIEYENEVGWSAHLFKSLGYYAGHKHILASNIPDIIGTTEAIKALCLGYQITKKKEWYDAAMKGINYILAVHVTSMKIDNQNYTVVKYTPAEKARVVFNVSGLFLETLAEYLKITNESKHDLIAVGEDVLEFLIKYQYKDGAWAYSYYTEIKEYRNQFDYHQGFKLDGIMAFYPYIGKKELKERAKETLKKGSKYYREVLFTPEGVSYYRYPKRYPIDIHNQAQGVLTFSKLYAFEKNIEHIKCAEKILSWTLQNMWDKRGFFYSHKWPFFTNRTPYIRWSHAWMMHAIATFCRVVSAHPIT